MKTKIKTDWNFKLFYKSDTDPQIEKDIALYERVVKSFAKKYQNKDDYLNDSKKLLQACNDYESIVAMTETFKPLFFFYLRRDADSNNKIARSRISDLSNRYNKIHNQLIFFRLNLGKIPKKQQEYFLKDKILHKYKYFLKVIFDRAQYQLSEPEEKIINLLSLPAEDMWTDGFSKVLSNQTVKFKGKNIPINQAFGMMSELKTKDRHTLGDILNKKLIEISDFAEAEVNAVVSKKKITDELRGYKKPYSSIVKSYENEDQTIENLINVVTKNYKISHRFYKIKAKLLKQKKLRYSDRSAKLGNIKAKFDFNETVKIVGSAFNKFDPKYKNILDLYLSNGQINVYPKKGKTGGAYSWSSYHLPTFILLNHTDNFKSAITFGHEMGHAFHAKLSEKQDPIYTGYTMSVAEVASTFFENFVFDELFEKLSADEKVIALHDRIDSQISTIFRQVACFNFEKELHEKIRSSGYVGKEEISKTMNAHMKAYLGPVFEFTDHDGYFFVNWSHIRRFFYVYSYAFGALISTALYSKYKKDKNFIKHVEKFLSAGCSKSPEDIFADAGLNIRDAKFFEEGIKQVERDVIKLEKLVG